MDKAREQILQNELFSSLVSTGSKDDWLEQYQEEYQDVESWEAFWQNKCNIHSFSRNQGTRCIYLVPIGEYREEAEQSYGPINVECSYPREEGSDKVGTKRSKVSSRMEHPKRRKLTKTIFNRNKVGPNITVLSKYVEAFYSGIPVKLLERLSICDSDGEISMKVEIDETDLFYPLETRRCHKYDRKKVPNHERQIKVGDILWALKNLYDSEYSENSWCICGITMEDLYEDDKDSYTVGLAHGGDNVACFSFSRYVPIDIQNIHISELRGICIDKNVEKDRFLLKMDYHNRLVLLKLALLRRSCKVLVHELGHLFGIGHCVLCSCCMNGSGNLEEDYSQSMHLCPIDLQKIMNLINQNGNAVTPSDRYNELLSFYQEFGFEKDADWVTKRLNNF
eukprot:TRINITY_DN1060_c0_g1_i2.p1 TRINITY_DN1060_c0_g1~~TRINITY_DN1060_c0_g1_i2.p1  ORF type:complete len:394 (+),score=69.34 TRINITY_DN1060_c0_g1_i2:16-1197(+)